MCNEAVSLVREWTKYEIGESSVRLVAVGWRGLDYFLHDLIIQHFSLHQSRCIRLTLTNIRPMHVTVSRGVMVSGPLVCRFVRYNLLWRRCRLLPVMVAWGHLGGFRAWYGISEGKLKRRVGVSFGYTNRFRTGGACGCGWFASHWVIPSIVTLAACEGCPLQRLHSLPQRHSATPLGWFKTVAVDYGKDKIMGWLICDNLPIKRLPLLLYLLSLH